MERESSCSVKMASTLQRWTQGRSAHTTGGVTERKESIESTVDLYPSNQCMYSA